MNVLKQYRYKCKKTLFNTAYENAALVETAEVLLKVTGEGWYFQAYNAQATYLYNTKLLRDSFETYSTPSDAFIIKFKIMTGILKDFAETLTIDILPEYETLLVKDEENNLKIPFLELAEDNDEYIPQLNVPTAPETLEIPANIDLGKELANVCNKVAKQILFKHNAQSVLQISATNKVTGISKGKKLTIPNSVPITYETNFTPQIKNILTTLKNKTYTIKYFKTERMWLLTSTTDLTEYLIMLECLMTE